MSIILTDAPSLALPPLTKTEAEAFASMDVVMKRYQLGEWMRCVTCFAAHRKDGVRSVVTPRMVRVECRCGVREFEAPQGTSNLAMSLASVPDLSDESEMTVIDGHGNSVKVRAKKLPPEVAAIIRFYSRVTGALKLNSKLLHKPCWDGKPYDTSAMEVLCDDSKVALKCACRVLHFSGSTVH